MPDHASSPGTAPPPARSHPPALTAGVVGLFVLALLYTVYFGRDVLLPICLALLLSLLLRPVVRGLYRCGLPDWLGAAVVVVGVCTAGGAAFTTLSVPAAAWVERMPRLIHDLQFKLSDIRESLDRARKASEQIESIAGPASPQEVVIRGPSLARQVLNHTEAVIANVVIMLVLLYFFLARGRASLETVIGTIRSVDGRVHYALLAATVQRNIAAYLATVTLINIGLGLATAGAMWAVGLPNPALWGTLAGVMNYIPFIGPGVVAVILALAGALTFDTPAAMLVPPAVFLALTTLEGNVLTPLIVGRRLALNPIAVFVSILFWGWMWGVPGALLAVPILAVFKIVCDAHGPLKAVGAVLGQVPPAPLAPAPIKGGSAAAPAAGSRR